MHTLKRSRNNFRREIGCVLITQQYLREFEFFYCTPKKFKFAQILLDDKNATYLSSNIIPALMDGSIKRYSICLRKKIPFNKWNFLKILCKYLVLKYFIAVRNSIYIFFKVQILWKGPKISINHPLFWHYVVFLKTERGVLRISQL